MTDRSKFITKYFPERNVPDYETGSLKFGTLVEYCGIEDARKTESKYTSTPKRMTVHGEGIVTHSFDASNRDDLGTLKFPGVSFYGGTFGDNVRFDVKSFIND